MLCDYLLDLSKILHVNIFAYDYTGYGFSNRDSTAPVSTPTPIPPSEEHFYADIVAAYKYLVHDRQVDPSSIILYGRSIGSGPSCYLASYLNKNKPARSKSFTSSDRSNSITCPSQLGVDYEKDAGVCGNTNCASQDNAPDQNYVGGLILHSPFACKCSLVPNFIFICRISISPFRPLTAVYRIVMDFGFTFQYDQFSNIDRISDVCCPVLIVHGTNDEIVPFAHGKMLYELVPNRHKVFQPFWAQNMGHNNIEVDATNAFVRYLMEFLQTIRHRQKTNKDFRGASRAQNEEVDLTKSFVQSHVVLMMDKKKRQHPGFLKRSPGQGLPSTTSPTIRTDPRRKSLGMADVSKSRHDQAELEDVNLIATEKLHARGITAVPTSKVGARRQSQKSPKHKTLTSKQPEQIVAPEARYPEISGR